MRADCLYDPPLDGTPEEKLEVAKHNVSVAYQAIQAGHLLTEDEASVMETSCVILGIEATVQRGVDRQEAVWRYTEPHHFHLVPHDNGATVGVEVIWG